MSSHNNVFKPKSRNSVWIEQAVVCSLNKIYLFIELFIIPSEAEDGIVSVLFSYLSPQEKPQQKQGGGWKRMIREYYPKVPNMVP